jgi:hypothetical protein
MFSDTVLGPVNADGSRPPDHEAGHWYWLGANVVVGGRVGFDPTAGGSKQRIPLVLPRGCRRTGHRGCPDPRGRVCQQDVLDLGRQPGAGRS